MRTPSIGAIKKYKVGDKINEAINAKWNDPSYLYKTHPAYIVDANKIVKKVFKTPFDAMAYLNNKGDWRYKKKYYNHWAPLP